MSKFLLGFVAGAATYHYVMTSLDHAEIKAELREFIKSVDERLAEEEPSVPPKSDTPPSTPTEEPTS